MQTLKTDIKQRILQVAHREFIENGVQRTCIRNVARKAGVTVGNLYHYFDSKDALFCAVLRSLRSTAISSRTTTRRISRSTCST